MHAKKGVFVLAVYTLLFVGNSLAAETTLSCNDCLRIAKTLESELLQLEQAGQPETSSLVGRISHHRRLTHPRSEPQIFNTLDALCDKVGKLKPGCSRMIQQHRSDLENDIYAEGIEHVRRLLCTDFTSLCPMHALYDTGEL